MVNPMSLRLSLAVIWLREHVRRERVIVDPPLPACAWFEQCGGWSGRRRGSPGQPRAGTRPAQRGAGCWATQNAGPHSATLLDLGDVGHAVWKRDRAEWAVRCSGRLSLSQKLARAEPTGIECSLTSVNSLCCSS